MEPKKLLRLKPLNRCPKDTWFSEEMYTYVGKTIDFNKAKSLRKNEDGIASFEHPDLGCWAWNTSWFEPAEAEASLFTPTKGKVPLAKTYFKPRNKGHLLLILQKIQDDYPEVTWQSGKKPLDVSDFIKNNAQYIEIGANLHMCYSDNPITKAPQSFKNLTNHPQWQFVQMKQDDGLALGLASSVILGLTCDAPRVTGCYLKDLANDMEFEANKKLRALGVDID